MSKVKAEGEQSPPPAKRMRQMSRSVFFEAKPFSEDKLESYSKSITFSDDSWSAWYEETIFEGTKNIKIYIKSSQNYMLADKYVLKMKIVTEQTPEGQLMTFEIDNPEKMELYSVDVSEATLFASDFTIFVYSCIPLKNGGIIRPGYSRNKGYKHGFDNPDRPHDVVLNFGDKKLYCNKVVLSIWSNFFDHLFFSETSDPELEIYDLPYFCANSVEIVLESCLTIDHENMWTSLDRYASSIEDVKTASLLEMPALMNAVKAVSFCKYTHTKSLFKNSDINIFYDNIITGLELADKYDIKSLKSLCASIFRNEFKVDQKKEFIAYIDNSATKLKMKTVNDFLEEGFGNYNRTSDDFKSVFDKKSEEQKDYVGYERNEDKLTDMTLKVGEKEFKVHKDYLAFWSPCFDRLFFGDSSEPGKDVIELKDIDPQEFSVFLEMIYPPRATKIDESNLLFLLKLAVQFEMKHILIDCTASLDNDEGVSPVPIMLDLLEIADANGLVKILSICLAKLKYMDKKSSKKLRQDVNRLMKLSPRTLAIMLQFI